MAPAAAGGSVGGREGQDPPLLTQGREPPGSPSFRPRVTGFSVGEAKKQVGSLENWFIWEEERERGSTSSG